MPSPTRVAASDQEQALADRFISALRRHPAGVAVITADTGQSSIALTAMSVSSLSDAHRRS